VYVLQREHLYRTIDYLGTVHGVPPHRLLDLLQHLAALTHRAGHAADSERRPLPQILVIDLGNGHVVLPGYHRLNPAKHSAFVFERSRLGNEDLEASDPDEHRRLLSLARDLFDLEGLDEVALFDVVVALDTDAALVSRSDLSRIVFESLE
jgi:hypothetical protein